jgi:hypothetical protein
LGARELKALAAMLAFSLIGATIPATAIYNITPERCYEFTKTFGLVTHWQHVCSNKPYKDPTDNSGITSLTDDVMTCRRIYGEDAFQSAMAAGAAEYDHNVVHGDGGWGCNGFDE